MARAVEKLEELGKGSDNLEGFLEDASRERRRRNDVAWARQWAALSRRQAHHDARDDQWRKDLPLRGCGGNVWIARRFLRSRPASGRSLELSRRFSRSVTGEHRNCCSNAAFLERIWDFLEQYLAHSRQQSLCSRDVYQLRSGRHS